MKSSSILAAIAAILLPPQMAQADIGITRPAVPTAAQQAIQGNCDLMATNVVRAVYEGIQQPTGGAITAPRAMFRVLENLGHRRFVRYGDGIMPEEMFFAVAMDNSMPGQPPAVVDIISRMQPGDEAIMKIDHLFIFNEPYGQNVRPCTRISVRDTEPGAATTVPTAPIPQGATPAVAGVPQTAPSVQQATVSESLSTQVRYRADGRGGLIQERIDIRTRYNSATGETTTQMFINGQEVDPATQQPIAAGASAPTESGTPGPPSAPQEDGCNNVERITD
ncbi:MAG: hypothetical protein IKJ58_06010 [Akkermansia sp.]|nr:hypothetical protein [Akkermansia sp.]